MDTEICEWQTYVVAIIISLGGAYPALQSCTSPPTSGVAVCSSGDAHGRIDITTHQNFLNLSILLSCFISLGA